METVVGSKLYEGMFLIDSGQASDWDATTSSIKGVLDRVGAEIVSLKKWDDRRLAYEIDGKGRGTYVLCYFRVDGEKIQEIEKVVQLSDRIMRVLILSAEHMTAEDLDKDTPAMKAEKEAAERELARTEREAKAQEAAAAKAEEKAAEPAAAEQDAPEAKAQEDAETEVKTAEPAATEQDAPEVKIQEEEKATEDSKEADVEPTE